MQRCSRQKDQKSTETKQTETKQKKRQKYPNQTEKASNIYNRKGIDKTQHIHRQNTDTDKDLEFYNACGEVHQRPYIQKAL